MYILNRGFCYSIIDTKSGVDIGKTFDTLEQAKDYIRDYIKGQIRAWKKEYKRRNKSKYSDYYISRQIEEYENMLKEVK